MTKNILTRDFCSQEKREYRMKIGQTVASALSGVVCGAIIASIIWYIALYFAFNHISFVF